LGTVTAKDMVLVTHIETFENRGSTNYRLNISNWKTS